MMEFNFIIFFCARGEKSNRIYTNVQFNRVIRNWKRNKFLSLFNYFKTPNNSNRNRKLFAKQFNECDVMLCYVCVCDDETNQIKMAIGNLCYLNLFLFLKRKINLTPFSPYNKKKSSPYIQWTLDNHSRLWELKKIT